MLSFWERESFLNYDTIIIGSGIVGLSSAISLKEKFPERSVLVLERGLFPTGASTRNAGFACFGSLTEILFDLKHSGEEKTFSVIEKRIRGLECLRARLGDEAIAYEDTGGYELLFEKEIFALNEIDRVNNFLKEIFPEGVFFERRDLLEKFSFDKNFVRALVHNPHEGTIHTGKMMHSLMQLAMSKGVEIRTGAEVVEIEEKNSSVKIYVIEPTRGKISFHAQQLAVCTNAFTNSLLPELKIFPGRGQVILTKPIENLPFTGAFHFDEGFYYFRNVGDRVLFGGGRNLAFEEETSTKFHYNEKILSELERLLLEVILPEKNFEIEQRWSGIMGFSEDKQPIVKKISDCITLGFSCNGMGVALGSTTGDEVAGLVGA